MTVGIYPWPGGSPIAKRPTDDDGTGVIVNRGAALGEGEAFHRMSPDGTLDEKAALHSPEALTSPGSRWGNR